MDGLGGVLVGWLLVPQQHRGISVWPEATDTEFFWQEVCVYSHPHSISLEGKLHHPSRDYLTCSGL